MRKQGRKIAFAMLFSMAVSLIAPSQMSALAAPKSFYYAEQQTSETIAELALEIGEQVDLKFKGVSDYKQYTNKWESSDKDVAVVDSAGNITARGKGTATIKYIVGDETVYTSNGVKVSVGEERNVTIGTAQTQALTAYSMDKGETINLKFYGLLDGAEDRYNCNWSSTDETVAVVSNSGKVVALKEGLTVIQVKLTNKTTGTEYNARPIALQVLSDEVVEVPTTTPTVKPTTVPTATATPTAKPTQPTTPTIIPTTTPAGEVVTYTAKQESDTCILLTFPQGAEYDVSDIILEKVISIESYTAKSPVDFSVAESNNNTEVRITPSQRMQNGEKYIVRLGESDTGKTIIARISVPTQVLVSFECLGKKDKAYAYDEEIGLEVPVQLSYRLESNGIDVTETYAGNGWITYELTKESEKFELIGDILNFSEPTTATLKVTFTYYDENDNEKTVTSRKTINAAKLPKYSITGVEKWTIVDAKTTTIDWNNPTHAIIAGTESPKVVALIADSYGYLYCTDERFVDTQNGIYSIDDYQGLFATMGYSMEFNIINGAQEFLVFPDGELYTYEQVSTALVGLNIYNNGFNENSNYKKQDPLNVEIKAPGKLSTIQLKEDSVTLSVDALPEFKEQFCEAEVEIELKDQYGRDWTGDYNFELSSNVTAINQALDGTENAPAYLEGTTLHINAAEIYDIARKTSVTFTVKETSTTTKRQDTINVSLKSLKTSDGEIKITSWDVAMQENAIKIGDTVPDTLVQSANLEIYKLSNSAKVGLFNDASKIKIQDKVNYKFTTDNCVADEFYILVTGPDGKPVKAAEDANSLGVWVDENGVKINVAAQETSGSLVLEALEAGKYSVKVTKIESVDRVVKTTPKTLSFTVTDNTKEVKLRSFKSKQTSIVVDGEDDLENVRKIIVELFTFNLGGKSWTTLTEDMILDVDYLFQKHSSNKNYIIIKTIEFAIPYGEDSFMSYKKTVELQKAIQVGVE